MNEPQTADELKIYYKFLDKYDFCDNSDTPLEKFSFFEAVLRENNIFDRLGHPLANCTEWKEMKIRHRSFLNQVDWIHHWFMLTYAQYLTIPRAVLQSMPPEWQLRFTRCLTELDEMIDWRPKTGCYRVTLSEIVEEWDQEEKDLVRRWGSEIDDPFADYERGRRRVPLKPAVELEEKFNFQKRHGE